MVGRADNALAMPVTSGQIGALVGVRAQVDDTIAKTDGIAKNLIPRADYDRERMDKYWNATVAAWYPNGKDDPRLTLLRLDARDAEVWISEAGPARFAWEIAKANATREQPDLGGHTRLNLH